MSAVSPLRDQQPAPRRRRTTAPRSAPARRTHGSAAAAPVRRSAPITIPRPAPVREPSAASLPRGARPLTRTTTAAERMAERERSQQRPRLVEHAPKRRRAMVLVVSACVVLFALLLGAVAFQTKLAQNQLALDKTERAVRDARERYDVLRRQRAQLRSPNRLAIEAGALGMVPAETGELITIDPATVAAVMAASSGLSNDVLDSATSLEQFSEVKAVTGDAP